MKKLSVILIILILSVSVVFAKEKSDNATMGSIVQNEIEVLKKSLPFEDQNVKMFDVSFTPAKELAYSYILKQVKKADHETVKENFKKLEGGAFTELCRALPKEFIAELVSTKTPIVYKYYDNESNVILNTNFDLAKCPKTE